MKIIIKYLLSNKIFYIRSFFSLLKGILTTPPGFDGKILTVIWDYSIFPYTFDYNVFMVNAIMDMNKRGFKAVDLYILVNKDKPSRGDQDYINQSNYKTIINNIVLESIEMYPNIRNVHYLSSVQSILFFYIRNIFSNVYPKSYSSIFPRKTVNGYLNNEHIPEIIIPRTTVDIVSRWIVYNGLKNGNYITITIRNKSDRPESNTDIHEWLKLIKYFDKYSVKFVIVPEYNDVYSHKIYDVFTPESIVCNQAALSTRFRAQLYKEAMINLMVDCGTHFFLTYQSTPYIIFLKQTINDTGEHLGNDYDFYHKAFGINAGKWLPFAKWSQRLEYGDSSKTLIKAVESLYLEIDNK
jgi:hypothetical protein